MTHWNTYLVMREFIDDNAFRRLALGVMVDNKEVREGEGNEENEE